MNNEDQWSRWKENKCTSFERPPSSGFKARLRDAKASKKLVGQSGKLMPAKENEMNDPSNGKDMKRFLRYPKEQIDALGNNTQYLKPCEMPILSDYLHPFLCD